MTITLLTESRPSRACDDSLLTGRLIPDSDSGLAVQASTGEITKVMWPFGYSARYVDDRIELLDADGSVVATEGDTMQMGGGLGGAGLFHACAGTVHRAAPT